MNENIDLTKILKDCPKDWEFYHAGYGRVRFCGIDLKKKYPIRPSFSNGSFHNIGITPKGTISKWHNGECLLFPSKDQRDWSKFTAPWYKKERFDPKTFQPFDKVIVRNCSNYIWNVDFYSCKYANAEYSYGCIGDAYRFCIPYNDDTKHLVGTIDEAPEFYKYWKD